MVNYVEGPTIFILNQEEKWCLLLDHYRGEKYTPYVTTDIENGSYITAVQKFQTPYPFRHGSVLPITQEEYERLIEAFGVSENKNN